MTVHPAPIEVRLAENETDRLGALRLRYRVFVEELGGDGDDVDHEKRLERDRFDPFYDHLIAVDARRDAARLDHVIGAYRLMPGDRREQVGAFYTEAEYDLSPLLSSGARLLELGRSCIDADYRGGPALFQLWQGLAEYVTERDIALMFGVASFHGTDVNALAHPLSFLHHQHLAPEAHRVRAIGPTAEAMDLLKSDEVDRSAAVKALPALLKAYLRLGGTVGEGAFVDHPFNTTDVCLVMDTSRISARQRALYASDAQR